MGLQEGSVIMVNCAHKGCEFRITLIRGERRIHCPECGGLNGVDITVDKEDDCRLDMRPVS